MRIELITLRKKLNRIFYLFLLVIAVLLSSLFAASCDSPINKPIETEPAEEPSPVPSETAAADDTKAAKNHALIWDTLGLSQVDSPSNVWVNQINFDESAGAQGPAFLLDGLLDQNPVIQWYSAYKLIDYLDTIDSEAAKLRLSLLLDSKEEYVKKSAAFALSILSRSYDSPIITQSQNGNRFAFVRFPEAYVNDGKVFTIIDHNISSKYQGLNPGSLSWSPDGNWLGFTEQTRITSTTYAFNVYSGEIIMPISQLSLESLEKHKAVLDLQNFRDFRPDPCDKLVEWSPDSKKMLLNYSYVGDRSDNEFYLVYSLENKKIHWAIKDIQESSNIAKPEGFDWGMPDYGISAGLLEKLPDTETLDRAHIAMAELVNALNENSIDGLKPFIDPSHQRNDAQISAALDNFNHCFGGLPIQQISYSSPDPSQVNAFRYFVSNEFSSRYMTIRWNVNGTFTFNHPFLNYSAEINQLIIDYTRALKEENITVLTRILSESKPYSEEQVKKLLDNYKLGLDLKSMTIVFSGYTGNDQQGIFYFDARNDSGNILNGIHVNYGNGQFFIEDSWIR